MISNCSFLVSLLNPIFIWATKIVQKMCNRFPRTNEHWTLKKLQSLARKVLLKRYKKFRFAKLQLVKIAYWVSRTKSWKLWKSIFNIQKHSILILDTLVLPPWIWIFVNKSQARQRYSVSCIMIISQQLLENKNKGKQKQSLKFTSFSVLFFQCQMTPNWWNP